MRTLALILFCFAMIGCGNSSQSTNNATTSAPQDNVRQEVNWYEDDMSKPVKNVGLGDAKVILQNADVKPAEIVDSTDVKGEPKKIYIYSKNGIHGQFEYSPNQVVLAWYQVTESPSAIELSQDSLKTTYRLARAMLGDEGKESIRRISRGGMFKGEPVAGYPANGSCVSGLCVLSLKTKV